MKMKMMLLALPPALGTTLLYAAEPQTGVINRDTLLGSPPGRLSKPSRLLVGATTGGQTFEDCGREWN